MRLSFPNDASGKATPGCHDKTQYDRLLQQHRRDPGRMPRKRTNLRNAHLSGRLTRQATNPANKPNVGKGVAVAGVGVVHDN